MKHEFKITGHVKVFSDGKLLLEKKNSIQPASQDIIRRCLAGFSKASISRVEAYNDNTMLAFTGLLGSPELVDSLNNNRVKFFFRFPRESFTGPFNKLKMGTGFGVFSVLEGFSNVKTELQSLDVEWLIEIAIL